MLFLALLIAGLVLVIAGGSWFTGAVTVGVILLAVAAGVLVLTILGAIAAQKAQKKIRAEFAKKRASRPSLFDDDFFRGSRGLR